MSLRMNIDRGLRNKNIDIWIVTFVAIEHRHLNIDNPRTNIEILVQLNIDMNICSGFFCRCSIDENVDVMYCDGLNLLTTGPDGDLSENNVSGEMRHTWLAHVMHNTIEDHNCQRLRARKAEFDQLNHQSAATWKWDSGGKNNINGDA